MAYCGLRRQKRRASRPGHSIQDATEKPVPGVLVTISGDNLPAGYVTTTKTNAEGKYLFEGLPNGTYNIVFKDWPAGYVPTITNAAGSTVENDSNGSTTSGVIKDADNLTLDLGIVTTPRVSVGDYVWFDANINGIQNGDEKGIEGVTLSITTHDGKPVTDINGNPVTPTKTDANGKYLFKDLPVTENGYKVTVTPPDGYLPTIAHATGSNVENDSSTGSETSTSLPKDGNKDLSLDFGFIRITQPEISKKINKDLEHLDIGNERNYTYNITVKLPNTIEKYKKFEITDTVDSRLAIKGAAITEPFATFFDVALDGQKVTAALKADQFANMEGVASVELVITAQIKAGIADEKIPNKAGLSFTNESNVDKDLESNTVTVTPPLYKLGDYVWYDDNRDGLQDSTDRPVPGVTVTISGPNLPEGYVTSTKTNAEGKYLFEGLPNGTYTIEFTDLPDGYVPTVTGAGDDDEKDSNGKTTTGEIKDKDNLSLDLGIVITPTEPTISKKINETLDHLDIANERDYTYNITVTLPNTIELYKAFVITDTLDARLNLVKAEIKGEAAAQFDVTTSGQTATATAKAGSFAALKAYSSVELVITAQIKAGIADERIPNKAGLSFTNESNVDKDLESNEVTVTPPLYKLGDYVWYDDNRDGLQDSTDRPVPGVTVTISGPNLPEGYVTSTKTNAEGKYLFENLPNGTYTIEFTDLPDGYVPTVTGAGDDDEKDSNGKTTTGEIKDKDNLSLDLGIVNIPKVSVGDFVWIDSNRNGIQDAGEPMVMGAELKLTDKDGNPVVDAEGNVVPNTFTNASGLYLFDKLTPTKGDERYVVHIVTGPDGYVPTTANAAGSTVDNDSSTGSATSKALPNDGDKDLSLDFGFVKAAVWVGDFVWIDSNYNGIQDLGEPGVMGAELKLTDKDGNPVKDVDGVTVPNTFTDASGLYKFGNLPPNVGDERYVVHIVKGPDGYVPTIANAPGSTIINDSSTGSATAFALPTDGDLDIALDFGFVKLYKLGDYVWYDSNKDGKQDASEKPVPGVTVTISGDKLPAGYPTTTTTDANGKYVFENLPNGEYKIVFSNLPKDYEPTTTSAAGTTPDNDSNGLVSTGVIKDKDNLSMDLGIVPVAPPEPPEPPEPTYPTLEVPLTAKKVLRNGSLQAGSFTFQLKDGAGKVLATVSNFADGTVNFPARTFSKVVTNYKYTVQELIGSDAQITYDQTIYTVLVSTKAVDGKLVATVNILKDGTPYAGDMVFTNQRKAPPTGDGIDRTLAILIGSAVLLMAGSLMIKRRRDQAA